MAGALLFSSSFALPFLTNCCIVGINKYVFLTNLGLQRYSFFLKNNITPLFFLFMLQNKTFV